MVVCVGARAFSKPNIISRSLALKRPFFILCAHCHLISFSQPQKSNNKLYLCKYVCVFWHSQRNIECRRYGLFRKSRLIYVSQMPLRSVARMLSNYRKAAIEKRSTNHDRSRSLCPMQCVRTVWERFKAKKTHAQFKQIHYLRFYCFSLKIHFIFFFSMLLLASAQFVINMLFNAFPLSCFLSLFHAHTHACPLLLTDSFWAARQKA